MAETPRFLSLEFHLRFLPDLIRRKLLPQPRPDGFVSSAALEFSLLTCVCGALLAIGIPGLASPSPGFVSVVLTILGGAGILAMLGVSIRSTLGEPLTWDRFEPRVFLFVIVLGTTVGLWTGFLSGDDRNAGAMFRQGHALKHALLTLGGTTLGYALGIPVALWVQKLGPLAGMVVALALPGVIGLIVTDLVVLSF